VKEQKENEKNILLLDAGDLLFKKFTGFVPENEVPALTQKAQLIIDSFNLMGTDAIGIGDDDLTFGKEFLLEVSKKASFPFLSSNVIDERSEKPLFHPYLIKEVNGLRIGIFSLLSPEVFLGQRDPRLKGLTLRPPVDVAQSMVKELQPKTDLIILLSHLGYPKDMEIVQAVSGIHLIVGSHTGMNLTYPPVVKNTVILQSGSKGMYGARFDLTLYGRELTFVNVATKRSLESNLVLIKNRLNAPGVTDPQKVQLRKTREDIEKKLVEFEGKNEFKNVIITLTEQMKDHPEILKMIEAYKSKFPEPAPAPLVEPAVPSPKGGAPVPKK
jgi:2',3'-cyclic-nucleotide 2'-phosphodiesterase (5'-nucleotidase family)